MTDEATIQDRALTGPLRIPGTAGADAEPPTVARSGNNVFVLWHEFPPGFDPNNPQPDIFLARSTNGGSTFQPRINLSNSPTISSEETLTVSGSRVYVVWVEAGDVVFRRDRENDGVYSNRITLSSANTGAAPELLRIAASGSNVFVAWRATLNNEDTAFLTRSTNGGDSFQAPARVGVSDLPQPGLAMTLVSDNRVLVAWRTSGPPGTQGEIFYVLAP
ncbi:hypothetical protein J8N05_20200 [Streptomyces sp. BH-SS-21]|uniref:Exo-alpha-sialidase n=1 Tax=Streptomyces liliiviolaceus TaxID=2823109 RepID=A0A940XX38_9ACTN|nr:hypothetical protein [Streptomyces liliiviolaceus]MBQ0850503.1 hypothetical protein [Streptomyces liliiviolaceus]